MYNLNIVCTTVVTKTVQLYNTKDHAIVLSKGSAVDRMVTANEVPGTVVADEVHTVCDQVNVDVPV